MAGDWIKIRTWLSRDPRVIKMADTLATDRAFVTWFTGDPECCDVACNVTRNVTVALCVTALGVTWGVAREQGRRENDDLVIDHANFDTLDAITELPGFGQAMGRVGWVIQQDHGSLRLPNYFRDNESQSDRHRQRGAERQARFRAKLSAHNRNEGNVTRNVTGNVTVTHREEKRREEKNKRNTPPNPLKGERLSRVSPPEIDDWMAYGDELGMTREEAQKAYDHYSACGWLIGKARKPMRDWRAVCRTAAANAKAWRPNAGLPQHSNGF